MQSFAGRFQQDNSFIGGVSERGRGFLFKRLRKDFGSMRKNLPFVTILKASEIPQGLKQCCLHRLRHRNVWLEYQIIDNQPPLGAVRLGVQSPNEAVAPENRKRKIAIFALLRRHVISTL